MARKKLNKVDYRSVQVKSDNAFLASIMGTELKRKLLESAKNKPLTEIELEDITLISLGASRVGISKDGKLRAYKVTDSGLAPLGSTNDFNTIDQIKESISSGNSNVKLDKTSEFLGKFGIPFPNSIQAFTKKYLSNDRVNIENLVKNISDYVGKLTSMKVGSSELNEASSVDPELLESITDLAKSLSDESVVGDLMEGCSDSELKDFKEGLLDIASELSKISTKYQLLTESTEPLQKVLKFLKPQVSIKREVSFSGRRKLAGERAL